MADPKTAAKSKPTSGKPITLSDDEKRALVNAGCPLSNGAASLSAEQRNVLKPLRFVRLANQRVPKTISRLRQIRNLASKANYSYTSEQAGKILAALTVEIRAIERAFAGDSSETQEWSL